MKLFKKKAADEQDEKLDINPNENINIQIAKLTAKVESMLDIRKSYSERFSLMSEQIGELRGMILDNSKQIQKTEVASSKAVDLVNEVQPEKFMTQLRKTETNIESLKAALETKESIMKDITEELQKIRRQMSFYRGIEQVSKLNDEIKKDLLNIKKTQTQVERHSDKVESIFIDLQKKYGELDSYSATLAELEKSSQQLTKSFDKISFLVDEKADKKEFADMNNKMQAFMTESRLEKMKEFTHDIQIFQKRSAENFEILKTVKQRTDDLYLAFENADMHTMKIVLKNLEKEFDLAKIDARKNKQIIEELLSEQQKYKKLNLIMQNQTTFKRQIFQLEKTQATLQKSSRRIGTALSELDTQKSKMGEIEATLQKIKAKTHILEKQSALQQLKGMGKGIDRLQNAFAGKKPSLKNAKKLVNEPRKKNRKSTLKKNAKKPLRITKRKKINAKKRR